MNCNEAREAMLTAELDELDAMSDSTLGRHLESCAVCHRLARTLSLDLDRLSATVTDRAATRVRTIRRATALGAAIAAAAIIISVVPQLYRGDGPQPARDPRAHVAGAVSVDIAPGQRTAVFATKDPKVTVVWIMQRGDH